MNISDRDPANLKSSLFLENVTFLFGKHKAFVENVTFPSKAKYKENPAAASPARPSPAQQELGSRGSRERRGSRARIREVLRFAAARSSGSSLLRSTHSDSLSGIVRSTCGLSSWEQKNLALASHYIRRPNEGARTACTRFHSTPGTEMILGIQSRHSGPRA